MGRLKLRLNGLRFLALLVFVFVGVACDMATPPTSVSLEDAGGKFLERLRWRDYQGAASYMAPELRQDFLDRMSLLKDLKVVDTRLEAIELGEGATNALTRGTVEYYLLPSITVQTLTLEQEWIYEPGSHTQPGFWLITTPFPFIPGSPMTK